MDNGALFLIIIVGVAIGEYLGQFMLYKTSHMWSDETNDEQ